MAVDSGLALGARRIVEATLGIEQLVVKKGVLVTVRLGAETFPNDCPIVVEGKLAGLHVLVAEVVRGHVQVEAWLLGCLASGGGPSASSARVF